MSATYRAAVQAARRAEILRAAISQIGKRGLAATTMDQCARAAGIAKGTLYLYFKDKDELLAASIQWGFDRLKKELQEIVDSGGTVSERLRRMLIRQLCFFDQNRQLYRAFLEEKGRMCGNPKDPVLKRLKKGRQSYVDLMIRLVSEGIGNGEFRPLPGKTLGIVWVELVGGMVAHRLTSTQINSA